MTCSVISVIYHKERHDRNTRNKLSSLKILNTPCFLGAEYSCIPSELLIQELLKLVSDRIAPQTIVKAR